MKLRIISVLGAIALLLAALYFLLENVYDLSVVPLDKRPTLFVLLGIAMAFLVVRLNTRVVRLGVRWWPGNIERGDVHVHHALIGVVGMVAFGIAGFAIQPVAHPGTELVAFCFGASAGLTLDEFALFLHLEDVYWDEQGRKSIDAVIMSLAVSGLIIVGAAPLGLGAESRVWAGPRWVFIALVVANALIIAVAFLKGRLWLGVLGLLVSPFAWWGAARLAHADSPWARWFYADRPDLFERARRRDAAFHRRLVQRKHRVYDLIGGAHGRGHDAHRRGGTGGQT